MIQSKAVARGTTKLKKHLKRYENHKRYLIFNPLCNEYPERGKTRHLLPPGFQKQFQGI